jgi:thiamine-phosphate pyrophosphorylase
MSRPFDPGLYLVTDRDLARGRAVLDVVRAAVQGGVTLVQIREKTGPVRDFVALVRAVKAAVPVPVLVNDRVDVALAAGADGAHVGQQDLPVADARRLLGPDAILGYSVETVDQARAAASLDVDYLGLSPIHRTPTKTDVDTSLGLDGVRAIRDLCSRPLVGIGGLDATNAAAVLAAGADGVAVVSAIMAADDPGQTARELRAVVDAARGERA